jgi:hypothetical protein
MMWARRAIGPIAAIWLVSQAVTLAMAPVLLEVSLAECVCAHGADATCPMHHKAPAGSSKVCAMQSATTSVPATLNALFSVAGLVPTLPLVMVPVATASALPFERSMLTPRPSPPDPPPPRF